MSGDMLDELLTEGWPVAMKQLDDFFAGTTPVQDINKLKKYLLDADMREYAVPMLADRINRQLGEFKGPLVVQVVKQRNVSYPKYSETTHEDGLIKIQLSDGFANFQALQLEPIPKLNSETPPGTKLRLVGKIPIENGMLLISGTNCRVLGGVVEKMIEKWNLEKNWLQKPIRTTESNAPRWVQFSKQRPSQSSLPVNATNKAFRANDVINGLTKTAVDERGDDFNAARKAQIEQAIENSSVKKFARSQLRLKPPENTASTSYSNSNSNKKDLMTAKPRPTMEPNKNRRFGREDKRNLSPPLHRPSNPPTLFDFVQSKVSIADAPNQQDSVAASVKAEKPGLGDRNAEQQGFDKSRRNRFTDKDVTVAAHTQQMYDNNNSNGSRTFEISNSNRYRQQFNSRSDRANESTYTTNVQNDYPSIAAANKGLAEMHLTSCGNRADDPARAYSAVQPPVFFGNRNRVYQHNSSRRPTFERRPNNVLMNGGAPIWKIGDKCLAPWSDGQFYPSTLVSMGPADMCTIEYDEYGNRSSVPIGVLLPPHAF